MLRIFRLLKAHRQLDKIFDWVDRKAQGVAAVSVDISFPSGRGGCIVSANHSYPNEKGEAQTEEWEEWDRKFYKAVDKLYKKTVLNKL